MTDLPATDLPVTRPDAQVHFGVFFQGVNHTTIWSDPESGSQTDFATFERVIRTAERGLFDAFFLGEGLRLRESRGALHDLDVVGRPDAITQLAALAAITTHIGLVATQNTTYNDPADLARRLQSLDVLSGGRAAWNVVTTDNAWTGANFRRGVVGSSSTSNSALCSETCATAPLNASLPPVSGKASQIWRATSSWPCARS